MLELFIHFVPICPFQPGPSPVPFLAPRLAEIPGVVHPISLKRDLLLLLWRPAELSHLAIIAPRIDSILFNPRCRSRADRLEITRITGELGHHKVRPNKSLRRRTMWGVNIAPW